LATSIGEGGGLLSGGEGQRVRLARAMGRKDARLVILDEAFRGLDRGQRQSLLATARETWRGATLICISHDLSDTRDFQRVLVIENGTLVEDGPPARLLADPASRYAAMMTAHRRLSGAFYDQNGFRHLHISHGRLDAT
jgi:ATP-binding cassette subfamily B protein